ncbi:HNH endonuclease [Brucella pseudogrignonensis]|uniref:HNH endonuclease n=1 Tax=Brucella pseudogrignonensis TaxID=419475 RepID=UPI0039C67FC2
MADWPYNTAAWQRLRTAKLREKPLCQPCEARGQITTANTVDHIVAIASGGDAFPALSGLMSMCARCHNEKTSAFDRGTPKPFARRVKGIDLHGNPVDPTDGWHGGGASQSPETEGARTDGGNGIYLVSQGQVTDLNDDLGFA